MSCIKKSDLNQYISRINSVLESNIYGERLRRARRKSGLSQQEFGILTNTEQASMSRMENGLIRVSLLHYLISEKILNCSENDSNQETSDDEKL